MGAASSGRNVGTQRDIDAFHAHLDVCARCESKPFDLCPTGKILIERTAPAPKMGWERAGDGPIVDIVRELQEFVKFAKAHPNGTIHVKRWNKTARSYDFGFVAVKNGTIDSTVFVAEEVGPPSRFGFENLTALVIAGWIGD